MKTLKFSVERLFSPFYTNGDINLTTNDDNQDTALSLIIKHGHGKCVSILCQNKNIEIVDMSFYCTIRSDNLQILNVIENNITQT